MYACAGFSPNILTNVVDIQRASLSPTPLLSKTVKCVSLQYHSNSANTSVSGEVTDYNDSEYLHHAVIF